MNAINHYVISSALGIGAHFLPTILSKIFPLHTQEDECVGHLARRVLRETFIDWTHQNAIRRRIFQVVIPDNLGIACGITFFFMSPYGMSIGSTLAAMIGITLHAIAALHFFRERISFGILAPISRRYLPEELGIPLESFFRYIGPSDLDSQTS